MSLKVLQFLRAIQISCDHFTGRGRGVAKWSQMITRGEGGLEWVKIWSHLIATVIILLEGGGGQMNTLDHKRGEGVWNRPKYDHAIFEWTLNANMAQVYRGGKGNPVLVAAQCNVLRLHIYSIWLQWWVVIQSTRSSRRDYPSRRTLRARRSSQRICAAWFMDVVWKLFSLLNWKCGMENLKSCFSKEALKADAQKQKVW